MEAALTVDYLLPSPSALLTSLSDDAVVHLVADLGLEAKTARVSLIASAKRTDPVCLKHLAAAARAEPHQLPTHPAFLFGIVHGGESPHTDVEATCEGVAPAALWRHAVQFLPNCGACVPLAAPDSFSSLVEAFAIDAAGRPARIISTTAAVSVAAATASAGILSSTTTKKSSTVPAGTSAGSGITYPGARFESPPKKAHTATSPTASASLSTTTQASSGNVATTAAAGTGSVGATTNSVHLNNPLRRGRKPGGVVAHPGSRFEGPGDTPGRFALHQGEGGGGGGGGAEAGTTSGSAGAASMQFGKSATTENLSRPSVRVAQPPGGRSANIFG